MTKRKVQFAEKTDEREYDPDTKSRRFKVSGRLRLVNRDPQEKFS